MTKKNNNKIKVVWLCHYSNAELQEWIKPSKKVPEYAPWIRSMIKMFENDSSIDLHIVSQHEYLSFSQNFSNKGIHYHIVRKGLPIVGRHWPRFLKWDRWTDFIFWKRRSKKIIDRIDPDIIHMHGFENEFCSTIFQFREHYPVFITVQGFVHQSLAQSKSIDKRKLNELRIIKEFRHFGVRTKTMEKDILAINPSAVTHWHQYPMKIPCAEPAEKIYDIVYFARLTKDKGIEDLLRAVKIIVDELNPDIKLCILGGGNITVFKNLAEELGIGGNISWKGFLPTQQDVYNMASKAKISVLPTYHDIISGTIIESLFLKIPVVAYNTGSIHEVNEKEPIIELVEKFDIKGLAIAIQKLTSDKDLIEERAEKGFERVMEMFGESDEEIRTKILTIYNDVINQERKADEC
ncbi:MAG: glycosyltransferase [Brumimicrobium sp.]|nr:glycosyltransferase [Brumimicrobium sp.]